MTFRLASSASHLIRLIALQRLAAMPCRARAPCIGGGTLFMHCDLQARRPARAESRHRGNSGSMTSFPGLWKLSPDFAKPNKTLAMAVTLLFV